MGSGRKVYDVCSVLQSLLSVIPQCTGPPRPLNQVNPIPGTAFLLSHHHVGVTEGDLVVLPLVRRC